MLSFTFLRKLLERLIRENLVYVVDNVVSNKVSWFIYGIAEEGKNYLNLYSEDFS